MIYGYIRPLYNDKECKNQLKLLPKKCNKIYEEAHGLPKKRIKLEELLMELQTGDIIIVERMYVLADSTRHIMELLKLCNKDGVTIHFLQEDIRSNEILSFTLEEMMRHLLQFQSDMIRQSTIQGIHQAREQGKSIGRPKKSDDNIKKAISMYHTGKFTLLDIKNETGISKSTLYRYLEMQENE